MFARKENKEYTVDANNKNVYLNDGYDIYDENGKIIEYSPKKQVPVAEYLKLEAQVKELKAELDGAKSNPSSDKELVKENKALEKQVKELTATKEALGAQVKELTESAKGDSDAKVQE